MSEKMIGGFFELGLDHLDPAQLSVWDYWHENAVSSYALHNARSALFYLLLSERPSRLWLPAYICADILDAVKGADTDLRFFPADPQKGADLDFLHHNIKENDAVLWVDYFGAAPAQDLREFTESRRDIIWIEDRCQMIGGEEPVCADWIIYSPRKILGVPDGGLLIGTRKKLSAPAPLSPASEEEPLFSAPYRMRYEDRACARNAEWYQAYRAAEEAMQAGLKPISQLSRRLLGSMPARPLIRKRRENAATLRSHVPGLATLPAGEAPFCVPIITPQALSLADYLKDKGIFCARHWPALAAPESEWPDQWKLAQNMLSIPCDQRYEAQDMLRIAGEIRAFETVHGL